MLIPRSLLTFALLAICAPVHAQIEFNSTSTSSSSQYSSAGDVATFEFKNVPMADVFSMVGLTDTSPVLVDETVGDKLEKTVTYSGSDVPNEEIVATILKAAELRIVETEDGTVLTSTKDGEEITTKVKSLSEAALDKQLDRPVRLMMRHTPLNMIVRFAGGMSGLDIQVDEVALRKAGINSRMPLSIMNQDKSLRAAMTEMLEPHGLVLELVDDMVVVTTKQAAENGTTVMSKPGSFRASEIPMMPPRMLGIPKMPTIPSSGDIVR